MNTMTQALVNLFERDLAKLEDEIKQYPEEESLWKVDGQIKNSGGNLCLHLCGNLQHFIGTVLGKSGYQRNRDFEFSAKNVATTDLLAEIQKTREVVKSTLENMDDALLEAEFPVRVFNYAMTTTYFLIHLNSHLTYHLGQVNYHRRLLA